MCQPALSKYRGVPTASVVAEQNGDWSISDQGPAGKVH
jgi:hypothetical protein